MTAPQGEPPVPGAPAVPDPTVAPTATPPGGPPAAASPWDGFTWDGAVDSLPEPVAKAIREARADAGKARTTAKEQAAQAAREQLLGEITEALGLGAGSEPPDPQQLMAQIQQTQAEADAAAVEFRVWKLAARLGADPEALLDSNRVCEQLDAIEVEPGDVAGFEAKASEVIAQWMAARPQPPAAGSQRTPVEALRPGTLPGGGQPTLDDQIAEAQKNGRPLDVLRLQNQKLHGLMANQ